MSKGRLSKWCDGSENILEGRGDIFDLALTIISQGTPRDLEIFFGVAWMI